MSSNRLPGDSGRGAHTQDDVATEPYRDDTYATTGSTRGAHEVHPEDRDRDRDHTYAARRDRVRWGPVWAGAVVALPTYLMLQLAIFAAGGFGLAGETGGWGDWATAAAALFALFLGGLTAGATAMWHGAEDGLLHGIVTWALAVVSLLFLGLLGGGQLLGPVAQVSGQIGALQNLTPEQLGTANVTQFVDNAQEAAGWALLGLALALAAAAIGGALGAKIWPREKTPNTTSVDVR